MRSQGARAIAIIALALVAAACGGAKEPPPTVAGAETIEVQAAEYTFLPEEIVVAAGEPVNIKLTNVGGEGHNLTIPDLEFELSADPGQGVTGGLTAAAPGEYNSLCTVSGHADDGMVGTLVVEQAP